jgi:phosphatidate cytidylyltransferase
VEFLKRVFGDQQRIWTGIGLILAVLGIGIIDNFTLTWLFLGAAFMFSFYEAMKLFGLENNFVYFYALLLWGAAAVYPNPDDLVFVILVIYASILAYKGEIDQKLFLPFLYPTASFLFLMALYNDFGMMAFLWLLMVVAGSDIGAYFVGKAIGQTKFSPTSPNKTIEGVVGGIVSGVILGSLVGTHFVSLESAVIVSFFVSVVSIFGDLFESLLKRRADVKDSGSLLPGHGGVLDRVDGYLFGGIILLILLRGIV